MNTSNTSSTLPIVIIGGGITGLCIAAKLDELGVPSILLEESDRIGGQIRTLKAQGFTFEIGPNTGTLSHPEVAELFEYLSPECQLEVANPNAKSRWIWKKNRFHPLPQGPISGLKTPLFSLHDKLRILLEPFRKKGTNPDESVGELTRRRLGGSFLDYAVDPFIGGIYAGDPLTLSTRHALPKLYALEQEYGSFIRGALAKRKAPKSPRDRKATKEVFSVRGGLEELVKALGKKISNSCQIITHAQSLQVHPTDQKGVWEISYQDKEGQRQRLTTQHLALTIPAYRLEEILPEAFTPHLPPVLSLKYAPVAEVTVGFRDLPERISRDAFGGLVPAREGRRILGILFPSSCFSGRVPSQRGALFTIFLGGTRCPFPFETTKDEELIQIALEELFEMMQIPSEIRPDLVHLTRYERAIPQYEKSSQERFDKLQELEALYPTLYIGGGVWGGVGLSHRIAQGSQIGQKIAEKIHLTNY